MKVFPGPLVFFHVQRLVGMVMVVGFLRMDRQMRQLTHALCHGR